MSGADELDEAIALANGAGRNGGSGVRPAGGRTASAPPPPCDPADLTEGPAAPEDPGGSQAPEDPEDPDDDELAAPAWITDRRPRRHPRTGSAPGHRPHHGSDASSGSAGGTGADRGGARDKGGDAGGGHATEDAPGEGRRELSWAEARAYATRVARPLSARTLPLDDAVHHTLAGPLDALTDLPPFDASAMDGWAVSGPGPWQATGAPGGSGILAGAHEEPEPLTDGHAVRVATGARLPAGASAVLRSEYGERSGSWLRVARGRAHLHPQPGTDIRPRGQECRSGDRLLAAGASVTPAVLGLAAAAGYDQLTVVRRPRAEVLVLGDELLHRGAPRDGRIRDALGPMVGPWLSALGAEVLVTRRLGDDAEALYEAIAGTTADLVVTTGGTAHGPVDHVRPTLRRLGARLLVDGVRVRPGHPMLLARLPAPGRTPAVAGPPAPPEPPSADDEFDTAAPSAAPQSGPLLVGLPGNPLAALSGLTTLAAPLLRTLADRPPQRDPSAPLTEEVPGHPQDTRLVPVAYSPAEPFARPLHYTGPAMLRGIASAGALAVVPPGGAAARTRVRLLALPHGTGVAW